MRFVVGVVVELDDHGIDAEWVEEAPDANEVASEEKDNELRLADSVGGARALEGLRHGHSAGVELHG